MAHPAPMGEAPTCGGWRGRAGSALQSRRAAAAELLAIVAITVGHRVFHLIPVDETLPVFLLGWLSLWLRGTGWRGIGLQRPAHVARTVALGAAVGVLLQVLSEFVTEPAIRSLTHEVADLSEFAPLVGNLKLALLYFAVVWTWAAFGEELTYRGYVLNRAADLGGRTSAAWVVGLLLVTALFGFGHSYQGLAGVLDTGIHGLLLGVLYLAAGRNLWPCIIAHGVADTVGIVLIYLGHGLS
jgi:membrane protease YdiL (CAAX protease family)